MLIKHSQSEFKKKKNKKEKNVLHNIFHQSSIKYENLQDIKSKIIFHVCFFGSVLNSKISVKFGIIHQIFLRFRYSVLFREKSFNREYTCLTFTFIIGAEMINFVWLNLSAEKKINSKNIFLNLLYYF